MIAVKPFFLFAFLTGTSSAFAVVHPTNGLATLQTAASAVRTVQCCMPDVPSADLYDRLCVFYNESIVSMLLLLFFSSDNLCIPSNIVFLVCIYL